ncbi:uncharacterized protein LY89DRAFT_742504 [Mollisia scopiformis]|uniref:Uncharacterized protein n=1 Tax=Mollisia scopiformis TaxID=149040 RepID=A0A132B651_MOLSC|nr:uncharacterized protein LY89DRAFT_742504 [Mollisia scopiformis]KUJ07733.1 hypothetical protein LY89DRAFT_742504 [Mollisia scopiformis]
MSKRKDIAEDPGAAELAKELDGLPLALSTAGAYLEHVSITLSEYLQLYKTSWLKLQTTSPLLNSYEDHNKWIQELIEDELNFNAAVTLLCSFGLVEPDRSSQQQVGARGYSVHSCVHSWIVFVLNKEWNKSLARLALTCVASEVPNTNEKHWWLLQQRLLQHATRQALFIADAKVDVDGLYWGFHNLGDLYSDQGKLAEAEAMYLRALEGKEKALGLDHTSTLLTVNNLGKLYSNQGKLAEAEAMYLRALEGYENALGLELVSFYLPALNTMFAFGDLFSQTDQKDLAKAMYNRALSGYTAVQGPSSNWCRELEDRLRALQVMSAESKVSQNDFTKPKATKSSSLKQKLRNLRRRLNTK